jgi:hypothetical protein
VLICHPLGPQTPPQWGVHGTSSSVGRKRGMAKPNGLSICRMLSDDLIRASRVVELKGWSARPQEAEQGSRQSVGMGSPAATGATAAGAMAAAGDGWARTEWREPTHGAAVWGGAAAAVSADAENWRARAAAACGGKEHWEEKDGKQEDPSELGTASQPTDEEAQLQRYSEVSFAFRAFFFTLPARYPPLRAAESSRLGRSGSERDVEIADGKAV